MPMPMTSTHRVVIVDVLYYDDAAGILHLGSWKCVSDIKMPDLDCLNFGKVFMTVDL